MTKNHPPEKPASHPGPQVEKPAKSPLVEFFSHAPAVIGAIATLITAVGGLLVILNQTGLLKPSSASMAAVTAIPTLTSVPPTATLAPTATFTPEPLPTETPAGMSEATSEPSVLPTSAPERTCDWLPYVNGETGIPLDGGCLDALFPYGVYEENGELVFSVGRGVQGTYGVCQEISDRNDFKFQLNVRDDLAASRFLVSFVSQPVPTQSAYVLRIQPVGGADLIIRQFEYSATGIDNEKSSFTPIDLWKNQATWELLFNVKFSGPKIETKLYDVGITGGLLSSATRYVCFSYQTLSTAAQSPVMDIRVAFP